MLHEPRDAGRGARVDETTNAGELPLVESHSDLLRRHTNHHTRWRRAHHANSPHQTISSVTLVALRTDEPEPARVAAVRGDRCAEVMVKRERGEVGVRWARGVRSRSEEVIEKELQPLGRVPSLPVQVVDDQAFASTARDPRTEDVRQIVATLEHSKPLLTDVAWSARVVRDEVPMRVLDHVRRFAERGEVGELGLVERRSHLDVSEVVRAVGHGRGASTTFGNGASLRPQVRRRALCALWSRTNIRRVTETRAHRERTGQLRDVPAFLRGATRRRLLTAGMNLLVVTDLEEKVLTVRVLRRRASYRTRSRLAYDVMAPIIDKALPFREPGRPPTGIGHLIRAREGRVVPVPDDDEWERALLWACGMVGCYTGDLVIVTPRGWRANGVAGWSPNLMDLSGQRLRSVPTGLEAS